MKMRRCPTSQILGISTDVIAMFFSSSRADIPLTLYYSVSIILDMTCVTAYVTPRLHSVYDCLDFDLHDIWTFRRALTRPTLL